MGKRARRAGRRRSKRARAAQERARIAAQEVAAQKAAASHRIAVAGLLVSIVSAVLAAGQFATSVMALDQPPAPSMAIPIPDPESNPEGTVDDDAVREFWEWINTPA